MIKIILFSCLRHTYHRYLYTKFDMFSLVS